MLTPSSPTPSAESPSARRSFLGFHLRREVTPFVILFIERDGSTYLTSLLAGHREIRAVYERFSVMRQKGQNAAEQLAWARSFLTPPWIGRMAACGFKTKLVDILDPIGMAALLRERNCRVIQMRRRNHVKAVVSRINARRLHEASGNWNLYREEDRMPPLEIDPQEFDAFLQERMQAEQALQAYVDHLGLSSLTLCYEELLRSREASLRQVLTFLRVRPMSLDGRTLKHTSDDLRQVVLNFDDLRRRYSGTAYGPMFDEVLTPGV
jgi:LPS sulfotransferase NodH